MLAVLQQNRRTGIVSAAVPAGTAGMREVGRVEITVAELVLQPGTDTFAYCLDLNMLVALTGRERTAEEYAALYRAAGLQLTRVIPTASMFSLVEGVSINE